MGTRVSLKVHPGSVRIRRRAHGLSIVEAMVALIVVSVGMLGVAGLYLESIRANRTALVRTQAINLVNDIGDRIRANRFALGAYAIAANAPLPADQGCVVDNNCDPVELATDDLARWIRAVRATLPADAGGNPPTAQVVFQDVPGLTAPDRYTITVGWSEPNDPEARTQTSVIEVIPTPP